MFGAPFACLWLFCRLLKKRSSSEAVVHGNVFSATPMHGELSGGTKLSHKIIWSLHSFEFCEPDSCLHAPAWQMWSVNRYGTHSARMRIAPSASCEARRLFHGPKYSKSRDPSGTIDWKDEVWFIMVAFSALLAFYEGIRRIPMYSHRKGREMRSIDVFQIVEKNSRVADHLRHSNVTSL